MQLKVTTLSEGFRRVSQFVIESHIQCEALEIAPERTLELL